MNVLTYKGYRASVEFDAEDGILVGRIAGINDVVGFHADDAKGIQAAFEEAVDDYVETCAKVGKPAEKTYSGKLMLRVEPVVHQNAVLAAQLSGMSLNQLGEEAIAAMSRRLLGMDVGPFRFPDVRIVGTGAGGGILDLSASLAAATIRHAGGTVGEAFATQMAARNALMASAGEHVLDMNIAARKRRRSKAETVTK